MSDRPKPSVPSGMKGCATQRLTWSGMAFMKSLAATIGFVELTREGQLTSASTYKPFAVYLTVAAIYFCLCFPLTQWSRSLERKLNVAR